jgi:hypothetical protein
LIFLPQKSDVYTPEKSVKYFLFNWTPEKVLINFWFGMFCSRTNILWAFSSFSRFLTNCVLFYPKKYIFPNWYCGRLFSMMQRKPFRWIKVFFNSGQKSWYSFMSNSAKKDECQPYRFFIKDQLKNYMKPETDSKLQTFAKCYVLCFFWFFYYKLHFNTN